MKVNQKLLIILFMALFFIIIFSIKVNASDTGFSLKSDSIDVSLNGSAYISYEGGEGLVTWESSDTSVATVENGNILGLKIGTTTITATRGNESDTCTVNVVYGLLSIVNESNNNIGQVDLVLNEYDTLKLYAIAEDSNFETVENALITWSSSDPSVVTVDKNGTIKGLKQGKAIITASVAGASDTCEVQVVNAPQFTDFSNAKYELLFDTNTDLKITGTKPNEHNSYYYIITENNAKPTISKDQYGALDTSVVTEAKYLNVNAKENYIYAYNLDEYVELNQDLYLWIIEEVKLDAMYINDNGDYIQYSTKFVAEGVKLTRPELPKLNSILNSFSLSGENNNENTEESTSINFRFPTAVENRKFTIKIGKITDNNILQKIKNNDYSGITSLLTYAKNNNTPIYTANLETTQKACYRSDKALFDGISLLDSGAYYYIYVQFDDENGKYYPIECVSLGQAYISSSNKFWDLWAYTDNNFEWNNLSGTSTETEKKEDNTIATGKLPYAGSKMLIIVSSILIIAILSVIYYKKYNWFKDIK